MKPKYLNTGKISEKQFIKVFDELPFWSAPFGIKLLDVIEYKKGIKVLDIGSGGGFPLIELANRLDKKSKLYGIDPWNPGVKMMRNKIFLQGLKNVEILEQYAEKLFFRNNYFDLIISNNGINNVDNPNQVLSECYRVAKKGCQFVITVNLPGTMKEFYSVYKDVLNDFGYPDLVRKVNEHIRHKRKSEKENIRLIESNGFKVKNIIRNTFYYRFADADSFFNHFTMKVAFADSWYKIVEGVSVNKIFNEVKIRLNRLPELKMTIPFLCLNCRK